MANVFTGFELARAINATTVEESVPPLNIDGLPVSSSRIRTELLAGNVAAAANLLRRPHRVTGTVATGQRRGQTLGFPTANLAAVLALVPGNGVYAVE